MIRLTRLDNGKEILVNPFFITVITPNNYTGIDEGSNILFYRHGNYVVKESIDEIEALLKEKK